MSFHTPLFLFAFLPICLLVYLVASRRYRNWIALAASLVFFSWGQLYYLPLMLFVILVNYFLGKRLEKLRDTPGAQRWLAAGIILNIVLLFFFKILVGYGVDWIASGLKIALPADLLKMFKDSPIPLGFSYVTFQLIAYLLDIHNEVHDSENNLLNFALYVMLFPKIITGPIARYRDVGEQLANRTISSQGVASGIRRFILGMAKKILIADTIARTINPFYAQNYPYFSTGIAWLALVGYSLQLYFDFSGYTDMAIGLGQMLGFQFVENFNYPYISKSITEFWRRWHISLSTWFRDYVFYPLEFKRRRAPFRQQTNIIIVFLLTGLWHGLTLNFIIWGLVHGLALAFEMTSLGRRLKKAWAPIQHIYALGVIMLGWLFFRSPTPYFAIRFLARLAGWQGHIQTLPFAQTQPLPIIDHSVWLALALGVLFSLPVFPALRKAWKKLVDQRPAMDFPLTVALDLLLFVLLITAVGSNISTNLVASIYGGF